MGREQHERAKDEQTDTAIAIATPTANGIIFLVFKNNSSANPAVWLNRAREHSVSFVAQHAQVESNIFVFFLLLADATLPKRLPDGAGSAAIFSFFFLFVLLK